MYSMCSSRFPSWCGRCEPIFRWWSWLLLWIQNPWVHSPVVRAADWRSAGPRFNSGWRSWFIFVTGSDNLTNQIIQMYNIMSPIRTVITTITRKSVKSLTLFLFIYFTFFFFWLFDFFKNFFHFQKTFFFLWKKKVSLNAFWLFLTCFIFLFWIKKTFFHLFYLLTFKKFLPLHLFYLLYPFSSFTLFFWPIVTFFFETLFTFFNSLPFFNLFSKKKTFL